MLKIAVVGTTAGWSSEKLTTTVAGHTGFHLLVDMNRCVLDLERNTVWFENHDLSTMDAIMIKKIGARYSPDLLDRLEYLRLLESKGVPIFSAPRKIMGVLDRLSCTVTLREAGIPMPPTQITESPEQALRIVKEYGEAVFKPLFTSKARGMEIIRADDHPEEAIAAYRETNPIMYIQKKIELPDQDLGLAFLGGEYLTTYARQKTNGAWNTTTNSGGKYAPFAPQTETIELARKAQALFGLDFTCVDVAETEEGPLVFEVSAFGGFRGIQEASGQDAAQLYLDYVLQRIGHAQAYTDMVRQDND